MAPAVLTVAAVVGLAGCGGSQPSSAGAGPAFPSTPAGVQAQWLLQALGSWPIPDAAIRAHFAAAVLATTSPADLNVSLAEWKQLGLVAVTSKQPDAVEFVVFVAGVDLCEYCQVTSPWPAAVRYSSVNSGVAMAHRTDPRTLSDRPVDLQELQAHPS